MKRRHFMGAVAAAGTLAARGAAAAPAPALARARAGGERA